MSYALSLPVEDEISEVPAPEEIRAARIRLNLTKAQAAELAGLPLETTWHRYETGYYRMPLNAWTRFQSAIRDGRAQSFASRRPTVEQDDDDADERAPQRTNDDDAPQAAEGASAAPQVNAEATLAHQSWIDHLRRSAASHWEPRTREENRLRHEVRVRQGHSLRDRIKALGVPSAPLARAVFPDHPDPLASWKSVLAGARVLTPHESELVEGAIRRLTRSA
jgi:hypothetical protein